MVKPITSPRRGLREDQVHTRAFPERRKIVEVDYRVIIDGIGLGGAATPGSGVVAARMSLRTSPADDTAVLGADAAERRIGTEISAGYVPTPKSTS
jgi:hypothetical protein